MKKKIAAALAVTFALGVTSAFAANPFVDVPAKHWAYDAVSKLAQAGIVDGYGDGTFRGDKNITRYEMAQIVAKALAKEDKANAEQKALLNKLSAEFSSELDNLGVRVSKLEKNASKVKITGETRVDYNWLDGDSTKNDAISGANAFSYRQRIHLNADITDKISYTARLQAADKFGTTTGSNAAFTRNYITVKNTFGIDSIMIGRQPLAIGRNLAFADTDNNDGIAFKHTIGKTTFDGYLLEESAKNEVKGINVNYAFTKNAEFNVGYFAADPNMVTAVTGTPAIADPITGVVTPGKTEVIGVNTLTQATKFLNAGFSYGFGNGVTLVGDFVQSDAPSDPKAGAVQLVYNWKSEKVQKGFYGWEKMVNPNVAHDQAISVSYFDVSSQALPGYGNSNFKSFGKINLTKSTTTDLGDVKGYMFGYQNMMTKNTMLDINYVDAEGKTSGVKDKSVTAAVEFYF